MSGHRRAQLTIQVSFGPPRRSFVSPSVVAADIDRDKVSHSDQNYDECRLGTLLCEWNIQVRQGPRLLVGAAPGVWLETMLTKDSTGETCRPRSRAHQAGEATSPSAAAGTRERGSVGCQVWPRSLLRPEVSSPYSAARPPNPGVSQESVAFQVARS